MILLSSNDVSILCEDFGIIYNVMDIVCQLIYFLFFSLPRKMRRLKGEVCWVLSPSDPLPVSCHSLSTLWKRTHPKNRFQPIRSRLRTTGARVKVGAQREPQLVRRRPKQGRRTCNTTNVSASSGQDEIDDIFSSLDFWMHYWVYIPHKSFCG